MTCLQASPTPLIASGILCLAPSSASCRTTRLKRLPTHRSQPPSALTLAAAESARSTHNASHDLHDAHDSFLRSAEENSNRHRMQGLSTMVVGYDYFATLLGRGAINIRNSFRCFDRMNFSTAAQADTDLECRESEINCLRLERFVGRRCLQ